MPGAGQQVLRGPGRRGCGQHHASDIDQELSRRHQDHHPAAAVPQQGQLPQPRFRCSAKCPRVTCLVPK